MNIFKRSVSLLLALVLVLSLGTPAYAVSSPRMELEVSSESVEATKTVEVTIKAYDIPKVFAMGFELHANNLIFETVSIDTNWSVSDQLSTKGYIRIATFDMTGDNLVVPEVIATVTLKATEEVDAADIWIEMQEAAYMDETMVDIAAPEKISIEVTPHTHTYEESTVDPTCTTGGYTLHKCVCGDEYKTGNVAATGHKYENNVCSVCGEPGTVIPEGAKFTDMLTDKGEIVTVTEKDGYYLVEVPYGTTTLYVTYPEDVPYVDSFGYVKTRMSGFDGVSDDGYGKTQKDGKISVGLALEKAPANGAPTTIRLINLDDQYGKKVTIVMADGSEETFALTYKLGNGQHFAVLPLPEDCIGYTVTGEPIASDGYTFNVSILEGYEATADFAVKVNGETVATEPGSISVLSVTEDLKVTVEGVGKVQNNTTDVIFNVDLTGAPEGMTGDIMIQDRNYNFIEESVASGQKSTAAITASDHEYSKLRVYGVDESLVTGWEINGTVYASGGKEYVGDLVIWNRGYYLQVEYNGTTPITVDVKPVVEEVHIHDYESVVTPPTCTEGGYTTYTCKAGDDTYVAERVPALGHTNVNGTCSVCGAPLTVIPEGAPFLDIMTSDGKAVTVTDMGDEPNYNMGKLYKVEVPMGTTQVNITYNEEDVYVDNFGYATVYVVNDPSVSQDGYGQTTKEGKTTVGLQMEKAAANGFGTLNVLNVPYPDDPYELRAVYLMNDSQSSYHAFVFTYALEEGQHFVSLPEGVGYTVSGDPIASNGYKFNVAIDEGFEATEDFAVKVNDEVVATQPGEVTVASVTEDLYITVEGVAKIADPNTDIVLTIDLTGYTGEIDGGIWYSDSDYNNVEVGLTAGKKNTLALTASKNYGFFASIYSISPLVVGYNVNGTVYAIPNSYTGYDLGNGFNVNLNNDGYMQLGTNGTNPGTFVIKPVLGASESVGAAPDFAEPSVIDVTDITVIGADVVSSAWEGDTLNVVLAEGTAANAVLKTIWRIYANNTKEGASQPCFNINGQLQTPMGVESTFDWSNGITLENSTGTMTVAFEVADMPWNPESALEFTNKTFTVNFTVGGGSTEPEQPESNPITEIELAHPNFVKDEQTGEVSMTMVTGTSEQIDLSYAVANEELDATQVILWTSSDPETASVENGKVTAHKAGTVTITAKAVDASGIALAAEEDEVQAKFTLNISDPTEGYTVEMGADVEAVVNNTVSIPVTIGHTGEVTKYNAFDLTFEYDPTVLELTSTKIDGMTVTAKDGKIHVERYGTDLTVGNTALTLTFKALTTGETNVKVTAAKVDISESALTQDAPDASVIDNVTKVSVTGFTVSLPTEFKGESSVLPGENYTFEAKDKNYNYAFEGSTMNGETVSIKDNGDGTFTIENVTGDIVILTQPTGKTFTVTLGDDMTSTAANAQYMTNYTATLTKADGYNYNVTVTIGGQKFTGFSYDAATGLITIPGEAITGEIVFNSNKTAKTPDKHSVEFTGEYGDIAEGTLMEVENGTDYVLTINKVLGYKYTVTATMGGEPVEVKDNGDGTYTIKNVTGDLVITIAKEYDLTVEVAEYVKLNGKVMFLVTATGSVDEGKILAYDGTAMFWSEQYNAWSYLVITEGTLSVEDAKAKITLNEGEKVELAQTYNVNESLSGTVDINDAQLVFDMYNNKYQDFTNATMQKFLKADVNGDKAINVNDAAAVVSVIVENKNK